MVNVGNIIVTVEKVTFKNAKYCAIVLRQWSVYHYLEYYNNRYIRDCKFLNTIAANALFIGTDGYTVSNCVFDNNTDHERVTHVGSGAALEIGEYTNVNNCVFTNNHADIHSGAIYIHSAGATLRSNFFDGNSVDKDSYGGSLWS
jgi:hypothetical protein